MYVKFETGSKFTLTVFGHYSFRPHRFLNHVNPSVLASNYYISVPVQDRTHHTTTVPLRILPANEARLADSIVTNENDLEDMVVIHGGTTLHHSWGGQRSKVNQHIPVRQ